jgi:hypothetical protein
MLIFRKILNICVWMSAITLHVTANTSPSAQLSRWQISYASDTSSSNFEADALVILDKDNQIMLASLALGENSSWYLSPGENVN